MQLSVITRVSDLGISVIFGVSEVNVSYRL